MNTGGSGSGTGPLPPWRHRKEIHAVCRGTHRRGWTTPGCVCPRRLRGPRGHAMSCAGVRAASRAAAPLLHGARRGPCCSAGHHGVEDDGGDHIGVRVGGRAAVLEVALALLGRLARDADGAPAVRHAPLELVDGACLVLPREAVRVALPIHGDVLLVLGTEGVAGLLDHLEAALLAHALGAEVGVAPLAIVALDGLGQDVGHHVELLADAVEQVARHPELVARVDPHAGAHLELPLARTHLPVGAADLDACVAAGSVVRVRHRAPKGRRGTGAAVVGALRSREAAPGPAQGSEPVRVEQLVLLLQPVPGHLRLVLGKRGRGRISCVGGDGGALAVVRVAHDEDVVAVWPEGVLVDGLGLQDHLRVLPGGLPRGGAIIGPQRHLVGRGGAVRGDGAALGPRGLVRVDPDVLGLHGVRGHGQGEVLGQHGGVHGRDARLAG
mmetsp:Transcript_20772/g.69686  ORF Transcript_20772/g.69686 Transcript_20772/m.69686 type:complete len:440 (-) Transcript_20772:129-1448(-)